MIFLFHRQVPNPQVKEISKLEEAKSFAVKNSVTWKYIGAKMDANSPILVWDNDPIQEAIRCSTSSGVKDKKDNLPT